MTTYSKYNIIYRLQKWLDSVPGQTFMNYAYSWGASVVIMGALFKLTHLPGANLMLFLGMGTEVFVFFLAGFDRPFDKTEDGKDLPTHVDGGVLIQGATETFADAAAADGGQTSDSADATQGTSVVSGGQGGIIVGGGGIAGGGMAGGGGTVVIGGVQQQGVAPDLSQLSDDELARLQEAGGSVQGGVQGIVGSMPVVPQQPELPEIDPEEMEQATQNYVEQLKSLTETLQKVAEQSERLTRDSEEMENLNRTLTGITKVYEMQLKGVSQQIGTIDQINDQTLRMAEQIAELNRIYARMIEAMTTNMPKLNSNNGN